MVQTSLSRFDHFTFIHRLMYLQTVRGRQSNSAMLDFCIVLLIWALPVCAEDCRLGWYGGRCQHECPQRCASVLGSDDVHCGKLSGSCSSGCHTGWHGDHCNSQCSTHCVNRTCNQQDGHCTLGCPHNREGHFCEKMKVTEVPPSGRSTTTESPAAAPAVIVVPVCIAAAVAVTAIIVIVLILRRKGKPQRSLNTSEGGDDEEGKLLTKENYDLRHESLLGNVDAVRQILSDKSEDINCSGEDGRSPVMCAASEGHGEVLTLLVKEGADLSLVDSKSENVLHVACLGGHEDIVKYLLTLNTVNIHSKGSYGRTPLMKAAEKGHREVFDLLIENGGDVSSLDDVYNNILHVACIGGYVEMVKHILSLGVVGVNSKGQYGRTPAMMAASCRHKNGVEVLKNEGADLSLVDNDGNNILHMACIGGHPEVLKLVLSLNVVDINSKGQHQQTPIRMVDSRKHRPVFDLLVSKGADLSQADDKGENILHVACLEGHLDLVKDIVTNDRVDVNSRGRYGRTPVMKAAEKGHKDVLDLLISKGGDVTLTDENDNNFLHVACIGGHVEMVKHIVAAKMADIDSRGQYGRTPVLMAAGAGHMVVVETLVRDGANMNLRDDDGNNILHVACYGGHLNIVKHVISLKIVDTAEENMHELTALKISEELKDKALYRFLLTQ